MFSYRTCSPYHLLSGLAKKCSPSGRKHWVCGPCLFLMISWTLDTWIPTYCFKIRKIHSNCKYLLFNYSRLPITRTFKGNRKKFELSRVRVIGNSKKIAGSKVKNSFYCTVNILITFYCRNVKWKLKDTFRL